MATSNNKVNYILQPLPIQIPLQIPSMTQQGQLSPAVDCQTGQPAFNALNQDPANLSLPAFRPCLTISQSRYYGRVFCNVSHNPTGVTRI